MDEKNKGGKPVAWACPGLSAGIGTEIGLACHRRFAADQPKTKIGLPEILVGIFPGAGGTTRVSPHARPDGGGADPARGQDAVGEGRAERRPDRRDRGARRASGQGEGLGAGGEGRSDIVKPWDAKGFKFPGGAPYHPAGFMSFVGANAMVHGKTQGVYPAAKAMLSAIYEGAQLPFDTALRVEARWFTSVLMNPSSSAMIRSLFLNKQALEKGAVRPQAPDQSVRKLGVLGAGMMGAGHRPCRGERRHRGRPDRP
jgi:3-hydroxyacyl-CoA dehydrogenase / enoyl-CoA hydratase / 3-hydroxybutyryl-CoA epimerase